MKAMTIRRPGGLDRLTLLDRDRPECRPGHVLVRIGASSLNYHDYVVAKGIVPVGESTVLMSDGAGDVVEVGDGQVSDLPAGAEPADLYLSFPIR